MKTVGFTIRIPEDLLRTLRFIAADREVSMNALMLSCFRQLVAESHISLPSDLLLAETESEKEH